MLTLSDEENLIRFKTVFLQQILIKYKVVRLGIF